MGLFTMKMLLILACAVALALGGALRPRNELTCQLCVDIVTDLDNWLTDDKTEQEIVDFVKQLCAALGQLIPGFQSTCDFLIESQLPIIIDGLVNDNLDPTTICTQTLGVSLRCKYKYKENDCKDKLKDNKKNKNKYNENDCKAKDKDNENDCKYKDKYNDNDSTNKDKDIENDCNYKYKDNENDCKDKNKQRE